jgi:hypothetical protein
MTPALQHNIGAFISPVTSVFPQSSTGGTINGSGIDRLAHNFPLSCVLHQIVGGDSGSPSAISVQSTLQHSPDDSTWTNYTPDGAASAAATAAVTTVNTGAGVAVDLSGADRYLRVVTVVTLTGGTSPAALVAADLIFGGEPLLPAA